MAGPHNLLAGFPAELPQEWTETLLAADGVRIERIVSQGHASPPDVWADQPDHEWVVVLQGAARLVFEGELPLELVAGSCVNIPSGRRHRVAWTDPDRPTIWLAVHYK
jgi:cupin 2 domain-containing protein